MPASTSFLVNTSFLGTQISNQNRIPIVQPRRPARHHVYALAAKKKSRGSSSKKPKKPQQSTSDPFSSLAAGPSARAPQRISRKKSDQQQVPESTEQSDFEEENKSDDVTADEEEKKLIAIRALGSESTKKNEKPFFVGKTAEDFISEGIVDDIDENTLLLVPEPVAMEKKSIGSNENEKKTNDQKEDIPGEESAEDDNGQSIGKLVNVTGDGSVQKKVIKMGDGPIIASNSKVEVQYVGKLDDGTTFDSSRQRNDPFSFELGTGTVIKGWEAGVSTMRVGEISEFTIAPLYGYGKRGMPPVIPGNSTLTFEIELLKAESDEEDDVKRVADLNPEIPRTPEDISKSYQQKMDSIANSNEKKSFFDNIYFISPFMSQTGEKPPWWLNPVITFSLIGLATALGFYVVFVSGAIHIGYVDTVDVNIFK